MPQNHKPDSTDGEKEVTHGADEGGLKERNSRGDKREKREICHIKMAHFSSRKKILPCRTSNLSDAMKTELRVED